MLSVGTCSSVSSFYLTLCLFLCVMWNSYISLSWGVALCRRWTLTFNLTLVLGCLLSCRSNSFSSVESRILILPTPPEAGAQGTSRVHYTCLFNHGRVAWAAKGVRHGSAHLLHLEVLAVGRRGCFPVAISWLEWGTKNGAHNTITGKVEVTCKNGICQHSDPGENTSRLLPLW